MSKKILWMSVFIASLSVSHMPLASAHDAMYPCAHLQKMESALDLSTEQKAKIHAIKDHSKNLMKEQFKKMHDIRHQINELIKSGSNDAAKMDDLIKQETDVLGAIIKERISVRQQIYALLTDAQKTKFNDMVNKWEEKHLEKGYKN